MRRVNPEGRAIVKSFSYPKSKDDFILKLDDLARKEGLSFSDIIMEGLEKYWLEHGESDNPQTTLSIFETGLENAIPNMYRDKKSWEKFYGMIKKKSEFKELDSKLNMILSIHNKRDKELE